MNLSHVELVLAVAKSGTISQAAENLFMSQSHLSKTIKGIENSIGRTLFKRSKAGIELTPFGQMYVGYAEEIVAQIHLLDQLSQNSDYAKTELRVCSEGYMFLTNIFDSLIRNHSSSSYQYYLFEANFSNQLSMIRNGQAELGFCSLSQHNRKTSMMKIQANNLEFIKLHDAVQGVYVSANSKTFPSDIKQIDVEALKILANMPFIFLGVSTSDLSLSTIGSYLLKYGYTPGTTIMVNTSQARTELMKSLDAFGDARYVQVMYKNTNFMPGIRFVPYAPELRHDSEFGWIQRENHPRSPLANELIQLLRM